jgi:hypothetical protein
MPTEINIPKCFAPWIDEPRWVVWRWVDAPNGRRTKPPFRADDPSAHAKSNDPATWASYEAAVQACEQGLADGKGFALMNSGLAALDLDNCRDPDSGALAPWAQQLVERSGSYAEITPSKRGIRIIGKAGGDKLHRKLVAPDGASLEIYRGAVERYITISGDTLTPDIDQLADIDALCDQIVAEFEKKPQPSPQQPSSTGGDDSRSLEDLIKIGCGSSFGGDKSRAVWRVINLMLEEGRDRDEIARVLINPANGISVHCLSKPGDPTAYALKQIDKAVSERDGTAKDNLEIARLAKLKSLDYDRERAAAAERMGCRVGTLDEHVQAERARMLEESGESDKQGTAVKLEEPKPWDDAVNGAELLDAIAKMIREYVIFDNDHAARVIAVWVVFSYCVDIFLFSPRLCITSPVKGCGKTTLLDIIFYLVLRPLLASNVSAAALFRAIEKFQPCLLLDECDTFLDLGEELRGVLNSGHRKGQGVLRVVGDEMEPRLFATFSACALALIGLPPPTVTDRSFVIEMKRKRPGDKAKLFRLDQVEPLRTLARKAARWAQDHVIEIGNTEADLPSEVFNRQADNWRILKRIAKVAGGSWPGYIDDAARAAVKTSGDQDLLVQLLEDIRSIEFVHVIKGNDNEIEYEAEGEIPSAILVQKLIELQGRPWAEMPARSGKDGNKQLSQNQLARLLKPVSVIPEQIGPKRVSGYRRAHFTEAFERYLSDQGGSQPLNLSKTDEMGTSHVSQPLSTETEREVGKCEKPNNDGQMRTREVAQEENGASTQKPPWPGLSQKATAALAGEFAGWAAPETGIRDRLAQYGAAGEVLESDIAKVLQCMEDEARRADEH